MKSLWPKWLPYPISLVRAGLVLGCFTAVFGVLYPDIKQFDYSNRIVWVASWMLCLSYTYHLGYLFGSWRGDRKAIKAERKAARKKAKEEARAAKV